MADNKLHRLHAKKTLSIYARTMYQSRRDFYLSFLVSISGILLNIVMPFYASKVLAGLIQSGDHIWRDFYILAGAGALGLVCNGVGIRASVRMQANTMFKLRQMVFERLMRRGASFYSNQVGGKLVSDALDFVQGFGQLINVGLITALNFAVTVIIGLAVIFVNNWIIGVCMLVLLLILGAWTYHDNTKRSAIRSARLTISKKVTGHLSDSIVNAMTVKTFAREAHELTNTRKLSAKLRDTQIRDWTYVTTNETYRMGLLLLTQVALILILIKLTTNNPALLATGIFAFTYTISLINRFFTIGTIVRQIEEVFLNSSPMSAILEEQDEIQDAPDAKSLSVTKGHIVFQNVRFHYDDAAQDSLVFDNLSLDIRPGEKIGLVGRSGGGKSTLTRLIMRFNDVAAGQILIDGQDIKSITQVSLRENIAYVPQEPLLFHRTIAENIAYGSENADMRQIKHAAKQAHAHEFISKLPDGYDTMVGERGIKLSGGQRQRIAIARAMLKNAPILVLDEATSALDSESEELIQDALWKLMEGRTAIVIAHRLSTIQRMDRILVMDNGQVIEAGSHKDLLYRNGVYAKLWQKQSGGFLEE